MRTFIAVLAVLITIPSVVFSCSNIFINKNGYHIEGRTLDFLINIAFQDRIGFIGEKNKTDIIIDIDKIPDENLTIWKNKYGYLGRAAFSGKKIIDGMNTQGVSVSILYLPGTQFPAYNQKDHRPVLSIYDLASYLLSQASSVSDALHLVKTHQLVQGAVEVKEGIFVKDIPIHYVIRDKTGNSAIIEFIEGEVKIYEEAGDVLTNAPSFDWQLKNAKHYASLDVDNKEPNKSFSESFYNYEDIYETCTHLSEANLLGLPGDFTSPSRFVRAKVLLDNFPSPTSSLLALYQADALLNSVMVPALKGAEPTLWISIKDLDNLIYYVKNILLYQGNRALYPLATTNNYTVIDLKVIEFTDPDPSYAMHVIAPTNPKRIEKIVSAELFPGFGESMTRER